MNLYAVGLVIFLTFLVVPLAVAWWMGRYERVSLARLAGPAPLPGESLVKVATSTTVFHGDDLRFRVLTGEYGPFPVDTGPLLIVSETTAAGADLARWARGAVSETDWLIEAGEREIGPVQ